MAARTGSALPPANATASISAGGFEETGHTCALLPLGRVECWGDDVDGELGDGSMLRSRAPVVVKDVSGAIGISAGGNASCALLADGGVKCWGFETLGAFGGSRSTSSPVPLTIKRLGHAVAVSTFGGYGCAVIRGGGTECWGADNFVGTLGTATAGTGPYLRVTAPMKMRGVNNAVAVSAGYSHVCVLLASGSVECWGSNPYGELGSGPTGNAAPPSPPVFVQGLSDARAVSVGDDASCALLSGGSVECWGSNDLGQLGDGQGGKLSPAGVASEAPIRVSGISNATAVSMGGDHVCVLLSGGQIKCWGENLYGELGDGLKSHGHFVRFGNSPKYDFSPTPVTVKGITNATTIAAGSSHTCATLTTGAIKRWGADGYDQLGDSRQSDSDLPVDIHSPVH